MDGLGWQPQENNRLSAIGRAAMQERIDYLHHDMSMQETASEYPQRAENSCRIHHNGANCAVPMDEIFDALSTTSRAADSRTFFSTNATTYSRSHD
jgi:hypothetical protein